MRANGFSADRKSAPDLTLTVACGDQLEHLALALGEDHPFALRVRRQKGIDISRATGGGANRTQQIFDRCLLQQDGTCSGAKNLGSQLGRSFARVHDDPCVRGGCEDVLDELDTAPAWHAVVEDGDVGLRGSDCLDGIPAVRMRRYDVVAVLREKVRDGREQGGVVVGNHAADALCAHRDVFGLREFRAIVDSEPRGYDNSGMRSHPFWGVIFRVVGRIAAGVL
jgi:hypothetical protein